ncbi:unnamed protein product, partial [Darwinula stevensoni]
MVADVECGQRPIVKRFLVTRDGEKIVGGSPTVKGEFPSIVSLQLFGQHFCGGSIINKRYILTAAHCVAGSYRDRLKIAAREYNIHEETENPKVVYVTPEEFIVHDNFRNGLRSLNPLTESDCVSAPGQGFNLINDIALIRLSQDLEWDDYTQPVCLPDAGSRTADDTSVTAVGWGSSKEGGRSSSVLQSVNLNVVSKASCAFTLLLFLRVRDEHLCARGPITGGRDACQGDSGGPLMMSSSDAQYQVGVVSAGVGCGRAFKPGLYTRVASFVPWIAANDFCFTLIKDRSLTLESWYGKLPSKRLSLVAVSNAFGWCFLGCGDSIKGETGN